MQHYIVKFLILSVLFIKPAYAEQSIPVKALNLKELAGLYVFNHKARMQPFGDEDEYSVSDVLEIVPLDEQAAYVRAKLHFSNGHGCGFSGIAKKEKGKLTYYKLDSGTTCIMDIVPTSTEITFVDRDQLCMNLTCGARGSYTTRFARKKKRAITYIDKLKNSPEYSKAIKDYEILANAEARGIAPQWANAKDLLPQYAVSGNVEGVKQSLAQGANPNLTKEKHWTPLTASAYSRNIEITKMMLAHGLSINAMQNGETFLTAAAQKRHGDSTKNDAAYLYIKWLLENGADANISNGKGRKAVDIAFYTEADQKIIDLLRQSTDELCIPYKSSLLPCPDLDSQQNPQLTK